MAAYNAATWPWQLAFMAVAAVLTLILFFRPCTWAKIAMKVYMVAVSLWTAFVYYMKFGSGREYSSVLTIFWCMMAAAWIYDLVTHFSTFQKNRRYLPWGIVMLLLPLVYPLVSVSRGLEFPGITTPMIPSAVAMYMLGMLVYSYSSGLSLPCRRLCFSIFLKTFCSRSPVFRRCSFFSGMPSGPGRRTRNRHKGQ